MNDQKARPADEDDRSSATDVTRATLLLRLKADGPAREVAWGEFATAYGPMIARLARHFGARQEEAEDVVAEVMSRFFAAQPRFAYEPQRGRFRAYLKVCTRNATIDVIRKRVRGAAGGDEGVEDVPDIDAEPVERAWERIWEDQLLRRAIEAARRRYAGDVARRRTFEAFERYVLLGHKAEAVASELGVSIETVHQSKTRVTKALKQELDALRGEYE